ncbi:MAG: rhomboid family intramembrane serine protease [Ignavibacteria bacterium]|nr:rhomboid family intramembrane serine protease [Ignavibacteria bacterium]
MEILSGNSSLIIFAITIAFSLFAMYINPAIIEKYALSPWKVIYEKKWYLVITSGFLHADFFHLLFNMWTFWFFCQTLELYAGTISFLIIYFASMILSDVTTIIKHKDNYAYKSLGASGAISGALFSLILFEPFQLYYLVFIPFGIPAVVFALLYLAYCYYAARHSKDNINHDAHFWGALAGIVLTIFLKPNVLETFLYKIFN